ncbi:CbiQ family ECF transporter T component [uncultured Jatrophihabitans sp.]|uniref:CbiQ family ECF transporter T component n=1 Tax=uncultured Jatrophihabitans sp. TaxID=1610747 RepID=UPI0035C972E2
MTSSPRESRRLPRALHPAAWWLWAIGIAVAVNRTTNPLLLLLTLAVLGFVVGNRRSEAPWARAFKYYLWLGLSVIVLRIVFRTIFGSGITPTDHIIFALPHIPTPGWYAGISIGGPVSLEATLSAATDGLRLATMLCCVGAANALANPKRALRLLPGALYELGMAVVVSVSVAPQLIESVQRVARARRLRAGKVKGLRALRSIAIPVLEDAMDRSLRLAAAMDSRGYGRAGTATRGSRRLTGAFMIAGMVGICIGVYGLLDGTAPRYLGVPAIVAGAALCCAGLALGSRRVTRTHYRPDPWRAPEWIVSGCGVASAALLYVSTRYSAAQINPSYYPLHFPPLPVLPTVAILLAAVAGFAAPPPERPSRPAAATPSASKIETSEPERVEVSV